jgi:hypothetical protein
LFDFITKAIANRKAEREHNESIARLRKAAIINAHAQLSELDVLTAEYRAADERYRESLANGPSQAYAFKCWLQWRAADTRFFKQVPVAHEANELLARWEPSSKRLHLVHA